MSVLFKCVKSEFKKTKSLSLWLAVVGIPLLGVIIGCLSFKANEAIFKGNPWFDYWTQVALFFAYFFYPLLISVIASYLWRVEHLNNNWKALYTYSISPVYFWFSKLVVLGVYGYICLIFLFVFYLIGGFILHLPGNIPTFWWWWVLAGGYSILAPASIQLYLSMRIRSFAIPSGICLIGTILGLGCYAKGYWFFPYTLSIIGINAQHEFLPSLDEMIKIFSGVLFWIVFISVLAVVYLKRREN